MLTARLIAKNIPSSFCNAIFQSEKTLPSQLVRKRVLLPSNPLIIISIPINAMGNSSGIKGVPGIKNKAIIRKMMPNITPPHLTMFITEHKLKNDVYA